MENGGTNKRLSQLHFHKIKKCMLHTYRPGITYLIDRIRYGPKYPVLLLTYTQGLVKLRLWISAVLVCIAWGFFLPSSAEQRVSKVSTERFILWIHNLCFQWHWSIAAAIETLPLLTARADAEQLRTTRVFDGNFPSNVTAVGDLFGGDVVMPNVGRTQGLGQSNKAESGSPRPTNTE